MLRELIEGDALFVPGVTTVGFRHGGVSNTPKAMPALLGELHRIYKRHGIVHSRLWPYSKVTFKMTVTAWTVRVIGDKGFRYAADGFRRLKSKPAVWQEPSGCSAGRQIVKVLHVTPGLETAGAETLLTQLVGAMDRDRFANVVISLTDEGQMLGKSIREQSIPLQALPQFSRGIPNPALVHKLAEEIKRHSPSVVHTWMYHASIVGSLSCALAGRPKLVWGLHTAKLDPASVKRLTMQMVRLGKHMSRRFPSLITCSSDSARTAHVELGYAADKAPNDLQRHRHPQVCPQLRRTHGQASRVGHRSRRASRRYGRSLYEGERPCARSFEPPAFCISVGRKSGSCCAGAGVTKDNALFAWSYVTEASVRRRDTTAGAILRHRSD